MPQRSKVARLPADVRGELDRRLDESANSGFEYLSQWLTEEAGYPIGKSALHEYASKREKTIERIKRATESAVAIVEAVPDDSMAMTDATARVAQERMYNLLMEAEEGSIKDYAAAMRAVADMMRATVSIRAERRKTTAEATEATNKVMHKRGVSPDTAAAIRAAIAGTPAEEAA